MLPTLLLLTACHTKSELCQLSIQRASLGDEKEVSRELVTLYTNDKLLVSTQFEAEFKGEVDLQVGFELWEGDKRVATKLYDPREMKSGSYSSSMKQGFTHLKYNVRNFSLKIPRDGDFEIRTYFLQPGNTTFSFKEINVQVDVKRKK